MSSSWAHPPTGVPVPTDILHLYGLLEAYKAGAFTRSMLQISLSDFFGLAARPFTLEAYIEDAAMSVYTDLMDYPWHPAGPEDEILAGIALVQEDLIDLWNGHLTANRPPRSDDQPS